MEPIADYLSRRLRAVTNFGGSGSRGGSTVTTPATTTTADSLLSAHTSIEVLVEDALPDVEPLLLLSGGQAAGRAEGACQHVAQARTEHLECKRRLPVRHGKARAVSVEDEDARVHLSEGFRWSVAEYGGLTCVQDAGGTWRGFVRGYRNAGIGKGIRNIGDDTIRKVVFIDLHRRAHHRRVTR